MPGLFRRAIVQVLGWAILLVLPRGFRVLVLSPEAVETANAMYASYAEALQQQKAPPGGYL